MKLKIKLEKKTIICIIIFALYAVLNFILVLCHEPWRDEVHAWLMAKELSIPQLFSESRFDGHPILWHLILMPFAKLNFPIITLNIISYVIMLIATFLFLFKIKLPLILKIFCIFTIPFTYTYSVISRNYCLIILLFVIIGVYYPKRFKKPILYSVLITLLIHTHSLAWGFVAGLTITFHFNEIYLWIKKKNTADINHVFIGLYLIIINTILVVFELYGTSNTNYSVIKVDSLNIIAVLVLFLLIILFIYNFIVLKKNYKEFTILTIGLAFQFIIYFFFYSSLIYQRYILFFACFLFYFMLISEENSFKNLKYIILLATYCLIVEFLGFKLFFSYMILDIVKPYSSAQELAEYINENVPENSVILTNASTISQTIIPYLNDGFSLYDIAYNEEVTCANVEYNFLLSYDSLSDLSEYSGSYIILRDISENIENLELVYKPNIPIINEYLTLYYIP